MYLMQTVSNGRRPGERVMDRRVANSTLAPLDGAPLKLDPHGKTDPYSHSRIEPYHSQIEPYRGKLEPYPGHIEPYHGKMESYHGHLSSEHARPALVTRTHGPVDQEPVYQNQGNFFQLVTPQKFTARPLTAAPHGGGSAFAYKSVQSPNYKTETPPYRVKPAEAAPYKAVETPHYKVKAGDSAFYKTKPNEAPPFEVVDKAAHKTAETPAQNDGVATTKDEKKRKWTLGGLFRRRKKAVAGGDSESSSGDDEPKLGFLARRRSRRDKRKARARGFDVVRADAGVLSADSLQATPPAVVKATASLGGSHDRLRDSSLSLHSSGGSGSLEGLSRRERRSVIMQRAEALRQHGSSSDEGVVDGGSLHRVGSASRRSRFARTERYIKRLSRDDETVLAREAFDKQRAGWDSEHASTASPGASPLVRPRHLATASAPNSSPASLERRHHGPGLRPLNVGKAQRGHSPLPPSLGPTTTAAYQPVYANYAPRSTSYDNNIHVTASRHDADVHVTCLNTPPEDKVMVVQFPVGRLSHFQPRNAHPVSAHPANVHPAAAPRSAPPPPPRRYTPVDSRPVSFVHSAGSYSSLLNASPATATARVPRPASVTPEDVHPLPGGRHGLVEKRTVFQYFADQNPRSRKPISIQCHAEPTHHGPVETEARYMSDSQMSLRAPPSRRPGSHVTDFWRQKDAEAVQAAVLKGSQESLNKGRRGGRLGDSSSSLGSDVERTPMTAKMRYLQDCLPGDKEAARPVVKMRHSFSNGVDAQAKDAAKNQPPTPPVRRYSRQLSADAVDVAMPASPSAGERKHSTNLEDALDELEAIYKSLKLGDEDLLDRAERRDLPTRFQLRRDDAVDAGVAAPALPGSMSDSGYDLPVRRRGPASRRSLIPDRVGDDMAYRRLHPKERPASQSFATGSFLLASPALSQSSLDGGDSRETDDVVYRSVRHTNNALRVAEPQPPFGIPLGPVSPAPLNDYLHSRPSDRYRPTFAPRRTPDVVNDDLAFRALRKDGARDAVIGAHEPRRTEDAVTGAGIHETLHFRRDKEAGSDALHTARLSDTNFSLRKRRAVRSLSANIPSLIGQDKLALTRHGAVELDDGGFEKAQSLTHLPDALEIAQKMLEGKEVIGGGGTGHLWTTPPTTTTPTPANRNSLAATSTETLTDSRANLTLFQDAVGGKRNSWQQRVRVGMPPSGAQEARTLAAEVKAQDEERKSPRKPETAEARDVESSAFSVLNWDGVEVKPSPAPNVDTDANTSAVSRGGDAVNQDPTALLPDALTWDAVTSKVEGLDAEPTPSCADDDELLTALAHDARVTSEQLELQLAGMERRLDELSDDSLEVPTKPAADDQVDDAVSEPPSREEVRAAQEELAQLHIYESDEGDVTMRPSVEVFDDVTEEDEEVQEIFQWENSRQFEANNNHVPLQRQQLGVRGTTTTTSGGKGGEGMAATSSGKWFGAEARGVLMACSYCVACTQQVVGVDWLTSIGIILAIVCLIALLLI